MVTVGGVSSNGISFTTTTGITQANLNTSRYQHSATTLNNWQILVVGGVNCPTSGSCTYLNSAELYNPGSSAFTNAGTMATARSAPAVLLSTGKVFVAGGYSCDGSGNCSSLTSAEIYDPTAGTFSSAGTMTVARSGHTMTVLGNGTVLIAGGENCTSATSVQCFVGRGDLRSDRRNLYAHIEWHERSALRRKCGSAEFRVGADCRRF